MRYFLTISAFFWCFIGAVPLASAQSMEVEPNNSLATANQLSLSNNSITIQGALNPNGDQDNYAIWVPRAGVLDMSVVNVPGAYELGMKIFDSGQNEISARRANQFGAPLYHRFLVCDSGTYYIRLYPRSGSSSTQLYSFTLNFDTTDVYECNNSILEAASIPLNGTIQAAINSNGDQDYFKVKVPRAGVFDIGVVNVPGAYELGIKIYDSGQNEISARRANQFGAPLYHRFLVCDSGTYYIHLYPRSGSSGPQLYAFTLNFDTTDVYECNNNLQTATPIALNGTIQAAINSNGDQDFFRVNVPRAGAFDFGVVNVPGDYEMAIKIYDSGQNEISARRANQFGAPLYHRFFVCDSGTYYIHLYPRSGSSSSQLYSFTIHFDDEDLFECNNTFLNASPINFCDSVFASIGVNGDVDYFSFQSAGVNQLVRFSLMNISPQVAPKITFYDALQNQFATFSGNAGQPIVDSVRLSISGQYYVKIVDNGNNNHDTLLYEFHLDNNCLVVNLDDKSQAPGFSISPNPAQSTVLLELNPDLPGPATLYIQDVLGKPITSQKFQGGRVVLPVEAFPKGIYLITVEKGNVRHSKRLIVN